MWVRACVSNASLLGVVVVVCLRGCVCMFLCVVRHCGVSCAWFYERITCLVGLVGWLGWFGWLVRLVGWLVGWVLG